MRNQTSFRLTTTLLPSDTSAKTTQVINKLDSTGAKFYPTFTEETVVLTNDDRTVMETTRATCTSGVLTFVKRGLSDDASATPVDNRKLTWNPGTLCFITAGAGDWIDKDDDITWTGDQTYTGDMESRGQATYKGKLITEKGVQYPSFENLAALEAYNDPFPGMFAVLESDGELYRYNAVDEEWSVVTTATPVQPEKATTSTIGTVRGATDAEFAAGTATGSSGELLVATPAQIQTITPTMGLNVTELDLKSDSVDTAGQSKSISYTVTRAGFIVVGRYDDANTSSIAGHSTCYSVSVSSTGTIALASQSGAFSGDGLGNGFSWQHDDLYVVGPGTVTATITCNYSHSTSERVRIRRFFYFG